MNTILNKYKCTFSIFYFLLIIFSCKEKNRVEKENHGAYTIEKTIKNNVIATLKTYHKKILVLSIDYKNNNITKVIEYYPNHKIKIISTLIKEPNHYYDISYYDNGVMKTKGESDYVSGFRLRRGGTIFYNKSGKAYAIMLFTNNDKDEYLTRHSIFDTIEKKTLKDEIYNPPLLLKKKNFFRTK